MLSHVIVAATDGRQPGQEEEIGSVRGERRGGTEAVDYCSLALTKLGIRKKWGAELLRCYLVCLTVFCPKYILWSDLSMVLIVLLLVWSKPRPLLRPHISHLSASVRFCQPLAEISS